MCACACVLVCVCVCVCVCVGVFSHPFSGASESFIVTPNLTQQDKMLPSALLFSALSLSSHSLSPFFFFVLFLFQVGRKRIHGCCGRTLSWIRLFYGEREWIRRDVIFMPSWFDFDPLLFPRSWLLSALMEQYIFHVWEVVIDNISFKKAARCSKSSCDHTPPLTCQKLAANSLNFTNTAKQAGKGLSVSV